MARDLVKFPRTPHLVWLGDASPRGDKLVDPAEAKTLLRRPACVEEKVDGANLGLSLDTEGRLRPQSRGRYLDRAAAGQWKPLWRWLAQRDQRLRALLGRSLIAFGEWCHAEHSVFYDALPDWFLLFDVYDRDAGRFWSRDRRDEFARSAGLMTVPHLASARLTPSSLRRLMGRSRLGSAQAEGLYLRWDDPDWLVARAKIVRPGWVMAGDGQWSGPLKTNRLAGDPGR